MLLVVQVGDRVTAKKGRNSIGAQENGLVEMEGRDGKRKVWREDFAITGKYDFDIPWKISTFEKMIEDYAKNRRQNAGVRGYGPGWQCR